MAQESARATQGGKLAAGMLMLVVSIALPFLGWFAAQSYSSAVAAREPLPNQNAMVVAFFGFCISCVVATVMFWAGVALLISGVTAIRRAGKR